MKLSDMNKHDIDFLSTAVALSFLSDDKSKHIQDFLKQTAAAFKDNNVPNELKIEYVLAPGRLQLDSKSAQILLAHNIEGIDIGRAIDPAINKALFSARQGNAHRNADSFLLKIKKGSKVIKISISLKHDHNGSSSNPLPENMKTDLTPTKEFERIAIIKVEK